MKQLKKLFTLIPAITFGLLIFISSQEASAQQSNFLVMVNISSTDGTLMSACDVRTTIVSNYDHTKPGPPRHYRTRYSAELRTAREAGALFRRIEKSERIFRVVAPLQGIKTISINVGSGRSIFSQNEPRVPGGPRGDPDSGLTIGTNEKELVLEALRFAELNCEYEPGFLIDLLGDLLR